MSWLAIAARIVALAVTAMLAAIALLAALLWRARAGLPYNELGRFYDSARAVVLHDSAVTVYGMLAIGFGAMALASGALTLRLWRRGRGDPGRASPPANADAGAGAAGIRETGAAER